MPEAPRRGPHFFLDVDMERGEVHPLDVGEAAVFTTRSPDKDTGNEDGAALLSFPDTDAVLVVADGLGGQPAGERASSLAIHAFATALEEGASLGKDPRAAVMDGFERANLAVIDQGGGGATTLAVALVEEAFLRTFHVGDSMILVVGQRGKKKLQTVSHSPVGYAVEAGLLDEREAMHHEDRHLVSNIVGAQDMRIEVSSHFQLSSRDTVVLATDGLFDNLHADEIANLVRAGPLGKVAAALVARCDGRMREPATDDPSKPDDLTFIAYRPTRVGRSRAGRRRAGGTRVPGPGR